MLKSWECLKDQRNYKHRSTRDHQKLASLLMLLEKLFAHFSLDSLATQPSLRLRSNFLYQKVVKYTAPIIVRLGLKCGQVLC
jgi:hypothetical protein